MHSKNQNILKNEFFNRPTIEVATDLLGAYLVRFDGGKTSKNIITEVEVYDGVEDKASHASRGRTDRTEVMFAEGGVFYVYLVYGMYNMLNIVVGPKNYPAAILIRSVESVTGPGRLTRCLKINKSFNKKPAVKSSGLWFERSGIKIPKGRIKRSPRVGVDYAGEWSELPLRFSVDIRTRR